MAAETGTESAAPGEGRRPRVIEAAAFLLVAAGFAFLAARQRELDVALRSQAAALDAAEASAMDLARQVEVASRSTAETVDRGAADAARAAEEGLAGLRRELALSDERIAAQGRLLDDFECRHESLLGRTRDELEQRLRELSRRLDADREALTPSVDRFRAIQRRADGAVLLIHCAFTYEVKEDDAWTTREATAWGTGFLVTADGLLVTNKHLVQPWKFDPELAALRALGEVRIREDAVRLAAWPVGEVCLDKEKKPLFENGFNSDRGDLVVVATAEDRNVVRSLESLRKDVTYEIHALDDRDLALLWIAGGPYEPLRLASADEERSLKKLDPVMTLGFPRGNSGLEGGAAESSATVGVVRKIENTIQVTAPIIAGNSGGPLLDERGLVVGVATRIYSETLGICIKAGRVRELVETTEAARQFAFAAFSPARK